MFEREVTLHGTKAPAKVCSLLQPISAKKYPALSAEEAAISIPLQTLSQVCTPLLAAEPRVRLHPTNESESACFCSCRQFLMRSWYT
jgi:hypothetical protein